MSSLWSPTLESLRLGEAGGKAWIPCLKRLKAVLEFITICSVSLLNSNLSYCLTKFSLCNSLKK